MLFKYNKELLQFVQIKAPHKYTIGALILLLLSLVVLGYSWNMKMEKRRVENQVMIIIQKQNSFEEEKLIKLIKELHFSFPKIVYAQAVLESGSFKSSIFKENNNCFGMKISSSRITLAKESSNGYAFYDNWMDSVYDYAFYSCTYLSKLKTEEDYYNYLAQFYAEDENYIIKLKDIVNSNTKFK